MTTQTQKPSNYWTNPTASTSPVKAISKSPTAVTVIPKYLAQKPSNYWTAPTAAQSPVQAITQSPTAVTVAPATPTPAPATPTQNNYWNDPINAQSPVAALGASPTAVKIDPDPGYKITNVDPKVNEDNTVTYTVTQTPIEPQQEQQVSKPSTGAIIAGLGDPISKMVGTGIVEAEAMKANPVVYVATKAVTIAGATAGLVLPAVGVVGVKTLVGSAMASVAASQAVKSTGLQVSLTKGVSFAAPGGLLTPSELLSAASGGLIFGAAGGVVGASGILVKSAVLGGTGSVLGYVQSGGQVEGALIGGVVGAAVPLVLKGAQSLYSKTLKPYVEVTGAKLQASAQKYVTSNYLESGKVGLTDRLLMKTLGLTSPVKNYFAADSKIIGSSGGGEWSLAREEATLSSKALIPKVADVSNVKVTTGAWAKGTVYSAPSGAKSSITQLSRQASVLLSQQAVTKAVSVAIPKVSVVSAGLVSASGKAAAKTLQVQKQVQRTTQVVVPATGLVWDDKTTQGLNPFVSYQGKPFYASKGRTRETVETVYLSYPKAGAIPQPKQIDVVSPVQVPSPMQEFIQAPVQSPIQTPIQSPIQVPILSPIQTPIQSPIQTPIQIPIQTPKETPIIPPITTVIEEQIQNPLNIPFRSTTMVLTPTEITKQTPTYKTSITTIQTEKPPALLFKDNEFLRRVQHRRDKDLIGGFGRYKREYPIMTGNQMLTEVLGKRKRKHK